MGRIAIRKVSCQRGFRELSIPARCRGSQYLEVNGNQFILSLARRHS
jgi:hypothetical protein